MTSPAPPSLQVFISYSHKDEELREELDIHLANLKHQGKIQAWHDRAIEAGAEWDAEIKHQLETAEIILLLITPRFIASNYCYDLEMQRAIQRHDEGTARVIPIIVKPCDWQDTPFKKLQVLPKDAKPITKWDNQDEAFLDVVKGIRRAVESLQAKKSEGQPSNPAAIAPTPPPPTTPLLPHFSTYKAETWTGRAETVADLTDVLTAGCRLLLIHGMTGIGKTTLAEKLAADLLVNDGSGKSVGLPARSAYRLSLPPDTEFHRISFDIGTPSTDFTRGALTILQAIGDDTAQQLPDEQILPYLLKTLEQRPYWLQFDSLEYLLHQASDGAYHFADAVWVEFFMQLLNSSRSQTRLVLTSQALPADLVDQIYRYDQLWHEYPLRGLEAAHWLDLFRNYNITPSTDTESDHLCNIASYFQGHPLILKMIAGDIRSRLFGGSISKYWTEYYNSQQPNLRQTPSTLRQSQEQRARQWVSQTIQQLPDLPRQMLQRCAVFRRPVAESFYLQMLDDASDPDRTAALTTLISRNLVADTDIQAGQLLIQQHNLIRDSAYAQLKATPPTWETAERTAAHLWLTTYTSPPNAERIETVRGYLEAFDHYCEVEGWEAAKTILLDQQIGKKLQTWGKYQETLSYHQRLIDHLEVSDEVACKKWLGNAYLSLSNYSQAMVYYQQSLNLAKEIGDRIGEGRALGNLGIAYYSLGQSEQAIAHHQQCLTIAREIGDRRDEGVALGNLGIAYRSLGQYEQAIAHYQQHLTIAMEIGDRQGEGGALGNLGVAYYFLGQYEQAIAHHQQDLTIAREIGNRRGEGNALGNLGNAYYFLGQYEQAIAHHHQSLFIKREIGNRQGEGNSLGNLGATQIKLEQYSNALENTSAAVAIFREIGDRAGEAEALRNLAELHQKLGEGDVARGYCGQALALATELGIPLVTECQKLWEQLEAE